MFYDPNIQPGQRPCQAFQQRACTHRGDHTGDGGEQCHACAHCWQVMARRYPHAEIDCRRKAELRADWETSAKKRGTGGSSQSPPVSWAPGHKLAADAEVHSIKATPGGNASTCNDKLDFKDSGNTVNNDHVDNTQSSHNNVTAVSRCHLNVNTYVLMCHYLSLLSLFLNVSDNVIVRSPR